MAISNTIFNVSPGGHSIVNDFGTVTSYGYNVSSDDGGGYLSGLVIRSIPIHLLGPLQAERLTDIHTRVIARQPGH